jgi:uncharacterized protein YwgA
MGEAGTGLTTRDLVLLVIDAAGGGADGRTVVQKLSYFTGRRLGRDLGHRAHFYGPYSQRIEASLKVAVLAAELEESIETLPNWYGGPDALKYSYALSKQGCQRVDGLKEAFPEQAKAVDETVAAIRRSIPRLRQKPLSAAAKIDLILREQDAPVKVADLPKLARNLGWQLTTTDVRKTVEVLKDLELVETSAKKSRA